MEMEMFFHAPFIKLTPELLKHSFIVTKKYLPVNVPILYPLKTPENFGFLVFIGGYKMGESTRNGLILFQVVKDLFYRIFKCFFHVPFIILTPEAS